jgi:hypothetical protein
MRGSILEGHLAMVKCKFGTELQIGVDMSHEPWRTVGLKLLALMKEEFEDLEWDTESLEEIIKLLGSNPKELQ